MPSFTDTNETEWDVALTMAELRRVREELGVDLGKPTEAVAGYADGNTPLLTLLNYDLSLIGDLLAVVLEGQLAEQELDAQALARRLDGATLRAARDALLDAIADFHHGIGNDHVPAIIQKERAARDAAVSDATSRVQSLDTAAAAQHAIDQAGVEETMTSDQGQMNRGENDGE